MLINKIQTFTALKSGPFAKLWVANWLLYISRNVELVTLSWIVLEITNSPSKVALVGACRMLPMFLLGMSSGSIADRSEKLRLLKLVQAINIIVVVSVVLLLVTDRFEFWHAYIATFLSGTLWTLDFAARRAYYSELFSPSEIVNPASLDTVAMTGSMMAGSALGGILIYVFGYSGTYVLLVLTYSTGLIILFSLPLIKRAVPYNIAAEGVFIQIKNSISILIYNQVLMSVFIVTLILNLFGFCYMQMVPVIARDVLQGDELLFGVRLSSAGFGAMCGALILASMSGRKLGLIYVMGSFLMLGSLFIFSFSQDYIISIVLLIFVGLGSSGFATMQIAIPLRSVSVNERGRAMGSVAIGIGASPIGMIAVGYVADQIGAQNALALSSGIGFLVVAVFILLFPNITKYVRE